MKNLFARKSIASLIQESASGSHQLKKTLGVWSLIALGIGAIIGAGLFVRTAAASAEAAGPAVTLSFVVAAIGCAFAGLCYAEFASMMPVAGSAYTYSYATMGEFAAWLIGWALILEYALGAATVSIAWSEYLNNLLGNSIPYEFCHSPFETLVSRAGINASVTSVLPTDTVISHGVVNIPALLILGLLTLVLIKGTKESAIVNAIIVFVKVAIVLAFIVIGWNYINPANHDPYFVSASEPGHNGFFAHGFGGVIGGAAIVFFAFIGFDAVSTAAQEAKNPQKHMPIGILGSLVVCTILYVLFSHVLTGVANWHEFKTAGKEASVAYAIQKYMPGYEWLATAVTVAILAGFSSVILVMLMGQSRVFYSMAKDGLMPKAFSDLHPKFSTPYKSNVMLLIFVGLFAGFIPGQVAGDLTSIGTLFAFVMVCAGVWMMRVSDPDIHRPFKTPMVPLVSTLGIGVCGFMIISLSATTQISALVWLLIGLVVYFSYGFKNSKLRKSRTSAEKNS